MKIERFEEIEAWKSARKLTKEIYGQTKKQPFSKDFGLRDQIQRASVSVMANIAEGFDGRSSAEFLRFLGYAYRSVTEVQSHLYVAFDQGYLGKDEFDKLYQQSEHTKKLINGFIRYLRNSNKKTP